MKPKYLILTVLLFSFSEFCFSQQPFYDAIFLNGKMDKANGGKVILTKEVKQLLQKYYFNLKLDSINQDLFEDNPFLKNLFVDNGSLDRDASIFLNKTLSSIGNLDVTNFADGLAKFLVARTKEELNVAFFDKLKEDLKNYPELQLLFPRTADFINLIESYNYAVMIQTLREAFEADLKNLPGNFIKLDRLTTGNCSSLADDKKTACEERMKFIQDFNHKEQSLYFYSAAILMQSLQNGDNAADIIKHIAEGAQVDKFKSSNISNVITSSMIFSESIRSREKSEVWIDKDSLELIFKDPMAQRIFMGLLYQQFKNNNVAFTINGTTTPVTTILSNGNTYIQKFSNYLRKVHAPAEIINNDVKEITARKSKGEAFTADDYTLYMNHLIDLLEVLTDAPVDLTTTTTTTIVSIEEIKNYLAAARSGVAMYYDVKKANYSSAIFDAVIILEKLLGDDFKFKNEIIKYGTFMASVAQAKNSDEVAAAIEAVAMPSGSSRVKRESLYNISLNGYTGLYAGCEWMYALKNTDGNNKSSFSAGIAAPVGIAFSKGSLWKKNEEKGGKSMTAFLSLIDIGALASFRFNDDSTAVASTVQLKNIISPGIFLIYGFPKVPVSLAAGCQVGPQLRNINATDISLSDNFYMRTSVSLLIDIPILNFYTKSK